MEEIKQIRLHKYQDEILFAPERFKAAVAGIQSGKTLAGAVWSRMQFDAHETDEDVGLICAPTYKILEQGTLPKFFEINQDLKKYHKKGSNSIEIPGMGRIYIRSTENPNAIESMTCKWIWADEAGDMKYDAWINMQGRVSIRQGKIMLTSTPYNMGWFFSDFYQNAKNGVPEYKVVQWKSIDNPYFPQEEYDRAKSTMDPRVFRRKYEGVFEKMEGLVYEDFNYGFHVVDEVPETFDHVIAGIDWGYDDPTAITFFGLKNDCWYLIREYKESKRTQLEIEEFAKGVKERWNVARWYPDSAEPDRIESFRRAGLYCVDVNKEISWGIQKVQELLRTDRLKVHKSCVKFIDEIEQYHYPAVKDGRESGDVPVHTNCHLLDAMRYALATFQPIIKRPRSPIQLIRPSMISKVGF